MMNVRAVNIIGYLIGTFFLIGGISDGNVYLILLAAALYAMNIFKIGCFGNCKVEINDSSN